MIFATEYLKKEIVDFVRAVQMTEKLAGPLCACISEFFGDDDSASALALAVDFVHRLSDADFYSVDGQLLAITSNSEALLASGQDSVIWLRDLDKLVVQVSKRSDYEKEFSDSQGALLPLLKTAPST